MRQEKEEMNELPQRWSEPRYAKILDLVSRSLARGRSCQVSEKYPEGEEGPSEISVDWDVPKFFQITYQLSAAGGWVFKKACDIEGVHYPSHKVFLQGARLDWPRGQAWTLAELLESGAWCRREEDLVLSDVRSRVYRYCFVPVEAQGNAASLLENERPRMEPAIGEVPPFSQVLAWAESTPGYMDELVERTQCVRVCVSEPPHDPHDPGDLTDTCENCVYLNSFRFVSAQDPNADEYPVFTEMTDVVAYLIQAHREGDGPGRPEVGQEVEVFLVKDDEPFARLTLVSVFKVEVHEL